MVDLKQIKTLLWMNEHNDRTIGLIVSMVLSELLCEILVKVKFSIW